MTGRYPYRTGVCDVSEQWKLVQPCGMDAANQQHIRNRYTQLCKLQNRGDHSIDGPPRHELYHIAQDPGETTDLAGEHPEIVRRMTGQYDPWFTIAWTVPPSSALAKGPHPGATCSKPDRLGKRIHLRGTGGPAVEAVRNPSDRALIGGQGKRQISRHAKRPRDTSTSGHSTESGGRLA